MSWRLIRPLFALPLVFQMLMGLAVGLGVGLLWPDFGVSLRPIGTAFVEAVKMIVIPIVFASVTLGIYRMGSELRVLGRIVAISLGSFYLATVISIIIGLLPSIRAQARRWLRPAAPRPARLDRDGDHA